MNDDDLMTAVRRPFATVHMDTPVDAVVRRGRVLRRRKRLPALVAATAAAAAATVFAVLPSGHPAAPAPAPRLAAWTVTRAGDGTLSIVIRELKDPAGLQARLRADGVPARVAFDASNTMNPRLPAGCHAPKMSDEANAKLQGKILLPAAAAGPGGFGGIPIIRIRPSAIPAGIGLYLGVSASATSANAGVDLVVTSPQCTG
jgi:hypothetical protein